MLTSHVVPFTAQYIVNMNLLSWIGGRPQKNFLMSIPTTLVPGINAEAYAKQRKALYSHKAAHGEDYEFNLKPMFRYNAYFGIHTVHYMDLVETYGKESLPLVRIGLGSVLALAGRSAVRPMLGKRILKPWAEGLFKRLDTIKFISYVGEDSYPVIIPLIGCQAADSTRLAFSPLAYKEELNAINKGSVVAVFGLTMDMEDVLVRGVFTGFEKHRGITLGCVDIDWVYNSMPPKPGQIYPEQEFKPVVNYSFPGAPSVRSRCDGRG